MTTRKDLERILRDARRQGWDVERTKGGHWRLYAPDGKNIVHAAGTPSDVRSLERLVSRMPHFGFTWKGR